MNNNSLIKIIGTDHMDTTRNSNSKIFYKMVNKKKTLHENSNSFINLHVFD